jgi:hypothetical protein
MSTKELHSFFKAFLSATSREKEKEKDKTQPSFSTATGTVGTPNEYIFARGAVHVQAQLGRSGSNQPTT